MYYYWILVICNGMYNGCDGCIMDVMDVMDVQYAMDTPL